MALHTQFASGRPDSEPPIVTAVSGGNLSSGTLWIGLQKRNRVGRNRISALVEVAATAGQKIQVQIPDTARREGEDWHEFVIVAATTNNPQQTYKIAAVPGYPAGIPLPLPYTLELSEDAHLEPAPNVATPVDFPSGNNLINGMIRGLVSTGFYYVYDESSVATPDGTTVFSASPAGRWLRSDLPQTYIADLRGNGGCDVAAKDVDATVAQPYAVDGSQGEKFAYWVLNDNSVASGAAIPQGARLNLGFAQDGITVSDGLSGKMGITFQGHWDTTTGALDSSMDGAGGSSIFYNGAAGAFVLQQDLQPGQAWAFQVYPQVSWYELQDLVPDGALISVSAKLYQASGVPTEIGFLMGDFLSADGQKGRVYPGSGLMVVVGSRSGVVANSVFQKIGAAVIPGLIADTAGQVVVIDSNGNAYVPVGDLPLSARRRALVSTISGTGNPGEWSAAATLSSTGRLRITCSHPVNEADRGIIRADYPDVIAGGAVGEFNPYTLKLYVQRLSTGEIREFSGYLALANSVQEIELTNWAGGVVVTGLPTAPASDFGLYAPDGASVLGVSGSGSFPAGDYRATFAYEWNGSQVTAIHHGVDGSYLYEATGTLAELFSHLANVDNPHKTGFRAFSGDPSAVTPDFPEQILLALETKVIYRATGISPGDLEPVGSASASGFVSRLITTLVFS